MKIIDIVVSAGKTGFYFDDQRAIKKGAKNDGMTYIGEPITAGFANIRQAGEAISVMLILEDGQYGLGDCAAVQYSGAGGRDPLFLAKDFMPIIINDIKPLLIGRDVSSFLENAEFIDNLQLNGKKLHTALRYGISQALLDASAKANHVTMAQVIQKEFKQSAKLCRLPIFTQSGDDRYLASDKMIIKGADVLPHALINNVETKLGKDGAMLKDYVLWLRNRIFALRSDDNYNPILHIDVYGTIGAAFEQDIEKQANYIIELEKTASPLHLRIEGPMDVENKAQQIVALAALTKALKQKGSTVELVADEWCNTYEDVVDFVNAGAGDMMQIKTPDLGSVHNIAKAVIFCKENNVGAYVGGTCNETNISAQVTTNIAMACHATQVLAKPGMGVDEGYMIVNNEMNRVLALAGRKS